MRFTLHEDFPGELLARLPEVRKSLDHGLAQAVARAHAEAGQPAATRDPMRPSRDLVDLMTARLQARLPALMDDITTVLQGPRR